MQQSDDTKWPSFADELGRKSAEVVERWMTAHNAGKISLKELYLIVNALYDATSGLVPRDVSSMLATIEKELRIEAKNRKTSH